MSDKKSLDVGVLDSPLFEKYADLVGHAQAKELIQRGDDALKDLIALNTMEILKSTQETKANPAYVAASGTKSEFDKGLREVVKPRKMAIELAHAVLRGRGKG